MKWKHFLRIALRNLRLGGQRTLVALLCVAFGVMSLTAMSQLSDVISAPLLLEARASLGGDMVLYPGQSAGAGSAAMRAVAELQAEGRVEQFTPLASQNALTYRKPGSGELHFASFGLGLDPATYPLVGRLTLQKPVNTGMPTLLQEQNDILITRDLAEENGLRTGDQLILVNLMVGKSLRCTITGIVQDNPDKMGNTIYYNLATAQSLAGAGPAVNRVLLTTQDVNGLAETLRSQGWSLTTAEQTAEGRQKNQDLFNLLLKGAGILGLLVGGIGIANTMQVLLARRVRDVAVLKSLGYSQMDLVRLLLIEVLLLGLAGSLLGAGLGAGVSYFLVKLFGKIITLLLSWQPQPSQVLSGVLVGVLTTICFAIAAIVRASAVRPAALLRNEAVRANQLPRLKLFGLALFAAVPFSLMTSLVMGSILEGVGVVLFALAGLVVLGGLLGGATWLAARLLPVGGLPIANMARSHLRRGGFSLVFAMIALFVGVVTMSLAMVVTRSADREMGARHIPSQGFNLMLVAGPSEEGAMRTALEAYPLTDLESGIEISVTDIQGSNADGEEVHLDPWLIGRSQLVDFVIADGAPWGSASDGVYVPAESGIKIGSRMSVTLADGRWQEMPVVGSYAPGSVYVYSRIGWGLLTPVSLVRQSGMSINVMLFAGLPHDQLNRAIQELSQTLPEVMLIDLDAYLDRYVATYRNLFTFALAMAGLSFLAGGLLIANAVSLAMIERRYELGVLKAIGYARRQLLGALVLEYSLMAVIASLLGLVGVQVFLSVLAIINHLAGSLLRLDVSAGLLSLLVGVGLTLGAVLAIVSGPTRISPAAILNDRL